MTPVEMSQRGHGAGGAHQRLETPEMGRGLPLRGEAGAGGDAGAGPKPELGSQGTCPLLGLVLVGLFPAGGLHLWGGSAPRHPPQMCKVPKCLNHLQGETEARGLKQGISSWGPRSPVPGCGGLPGVTWGGAPWLPLPSPEGSPAVPPGGAASPVSPYCGDSRTSWGRSHISKVGVPRPAVAPPGPVLGGRWHSGEPSTTALTPQLGGGAVNLSSPAMA